MKTFPLLESPTGGKYEQLWPTRAQGLSPVGVKVYHVAFLGLSPGSKTGSCFMVSYACRGLGQLEALGVKKKTVVGWRDGAEVLHSASEGHLVPLRALPEFAERKNPGCHHRFPWLSDRVGDPSLSSPWLLPGHAVRKQ